MKIDRYSRRIIDHLSDRRYRPTDVAELADELGVAVEELEEFTHTVKQLIEEGQVVLGAADEVVLPPPGREMTGSFRLHERGFGFLIPDSAVEHGDLFVPAGQTGGALTGDRVRAQVLHEPRRGAGGSQRSPYVGRVTEIIQRADKHYVGNLRQRGSQWVVEMDGRLLRDPVLVRDPHAKNAKAGDKVVVELLRYPTDQRPAEGVIIEVLGEQGEPDVETLGVMRAYGLADRFPPAVVDEARAASAGFREDAVPPGREDLTHDFVLTIDPPDAKDFDDAISIRRIGGGQGPRAEGQGKEKSEERRAKSEERGAKSESTALPLGPRPLALGPSYELGVHIAHVAHFVRPGGVLDQEARRRGNSAYLPQRVVPMLPELLSNGVCSLQEGVHRLCLSVFIQYDREGHVLGRRFARSVIRSAKRLTYLEAQALIDGELREAVKHAKTEPRYPRQLVEQLRLMDELAKIIRARRLRDGMIVLGLPDVELVFDDSGRVMDAVPEDDAFTHTLIEMFMVEANEAAAALFDALHVPMIRRIHADPPVHDLGDLRAFARVAGYNIPARPSRQELQGLLDAVRGKPAQHAVHLAVLKTLSKAEYAPDLIGHFALASEHYTHFTSPIRRYPDLVVHRGLDAYLDLAGRGGGEAKSEERRARSDGGKSARPGRLGHLLRNDLRMLDEVGLQELGRHCSATERNAEAAERDLRNYLVLDPLARHLGDDFDGTVTGVTSEGIYVQIDRYLADGFIRVTDLEGPTTGRGERWALNRATGALVAQRSGRTITIGNRFVVRIVKVNPQRRHMELAIVGAPAGTQPRREHRAQPAGARKAHQEALRLKQQRERERRALRQRKRGKRG